MQTAAVNINQTELCSYSDGCHGVGWTGQWMIDRQQESIRSEVCDVTAASRRRHSGVTATTRDDTASVRSTEAPRDALKMDHVSSSVVVVRRLHFTSSLSCCGSVLL